MTERPLSEITGTEADLTRYRGHSVSWYVCELEKLEAENARLRKALQGLIDFAASVDRALDEEYAVWNGQEAEPIVEARKVLEASECPTPRPT